MTPSELLTNVIDIAKEAGLSGVELLREDKETALKVCNGIGAWWMSEETRGTISRLFPALVPVSFIHDMRHHRGGRWYQRWLSDFEFLCNGFRMAVYTRDWRVAKHAFYLWLCLAIGSWSAFTYKKEPPTE